MKILFMCVANSARSQLAEALARAIFDSEVEVKSAGSLPTTLNPLAVEVMAEMGISLKRHYSKSLEDLSPDYVAQLDYVITLCAEEVCPTIVVGARKLHWPFPDPANKESLSKAEQLTIFREAREAIKKRLILFKADIEQPKN